jgi:AcrR family transcriptional regulator
MSGSSRGRRGDDERDAGRGSRSNRSGPPRRRSGDGESAAEVLARAAEKLSEKLEAKAAHLDRHAAKIAEQAAKLDRTTDRLASIDLWMRGLSGGRKPRFTHDDVRAAAMRIADHEGIDALSMRRLAAELQAPTMTLYYYVRTKDELLSLIVDAVMAEVVLPPDELLPEDWKEAMIVIATRTRDVLLRHRWISNITEGPSFGPASVRHFDQSLQALAHLDQPFATKLDILNAVDEYVFGYCSQVGDEVAFEPNDDVIAYVEQLITEDDYPQIEALVADKGVERLWRDVQEVFVDPDRFLRNLHRLLDGIERSLPA